jgi:hypothetical protein
MTRRKIVLLAVGLVCGVPLPSRAAPTDTELQAARDLFQQAVRDEDSGKWSEALEELRRVGQVKLTAGVRYHVALCEENLDQIATAYADYAAAEAQAKSEGAQDVIRLVGRQLHALGPRVPRLTLHLVPALPDAELTLDGEPVAKALLDEPMPLNPGVHRIVATAPDRAPTNATVTLQERDNAVVDVTMNPPAPPPPRPAPPAATSRDPALEQPQRSGPRMAAIFTAGGAAALATGGVVSFILAGKALTTGEQQCAAVVSTRAGECDAQRATVRGWDFAAAGMWAGAAGLAALSIVLFTAREPDTAKPASATFGPGWVSIEGTF